MRLPVASRGQIVGCLSQLPRLFREIGLLHEVHVFIDYQRRDGVKSLTWTNTLPEGWRLKPLRAAVDYVVSNVDKAKVDGEISVELCNYTDVYHNEFIRRGLNFMRATASESEIARFALVVDDVVITKDSETWHDIGVPALVIEALSDLICGYHLALLRPRKDVLDGGFLFRCLQAKPIKVQLALSANGVTRFGLPKSEIGAAIVPVPPLAQQRAIARYLNCEARRLDALVVEKERLLNLLEEKRQSLITRAVTRGVNPDVPCRHSGIEWLGYIPAQWESRKIAWLFRERDRRGYPDLPLLEVSLRGGVVQREFTGERIESTAADFNSYKVAWKGDLVFNKIRMWQGAVGVAPVDGLVSPDYVVAEPTGSLSPAYAGLLFRISAFSAECARRSHGIVWDRLRLYWDEFRDIEVPVPPLADQTTVVDQVRTVTSKLDELISTTEISVTLLKERRAALIAAAVTGQIDVASEF